MTENPIPVWANLFLVSFFIGWLIRVFVLPHEISKRTNRKFKYGLILPEERLSMTSKEKTYLMLVNVFGALGFIIFFAAGYFLFQKVTSGQWRPK